MGVEYMKIALLTCAPRGWHQFSHGKQFKHAIQTYRDSQRRIILISTKCHTFEKTDTLSKARSLSKSRRFVRMNTSTGIDPDLGFSSQIALTHTSEQYTCIQE